MWITTYLLLKVGFKAFRVKMSLEIILYSTGSSSGRVAYLRNLRVTKSRAETVKNIILKGGKLHWMGYTLIWNSLV